MFNCIVYFRVFSNNGLVFNTALIKVINKSLTNILIIVIYINSFNLATTSF